MCGQPQEVQTNLLNPNQESIQGHIPPSHLGVLSSPAPLILFAFSTTENKQCRALVGNASF